MRDLERSGEPSPAYLADLSGGAGKATSKAIGDGVAFTRLPMRGLRRGADGSHRAISQGRRDTTSSALSIHSSVGCSSPMKSTPCRRSLRPGGKNTRRTFRIDSRSPLIGIVGLAVRRATRGRMPAELRSCPAEPGFRPFAPSREHSPHCSRLRTTDLNQCRKRSACPGSFGSCP